MFTWMKNTASSCWNGRYTRMANSDSDNEEAFEDSSSVPTRDPLLWSRELGKHCYGDYSYAIAQANRVIEDHSQIEVGRDSTFVGVFDGHGGAEASRYSREHFFTHLINDVKDSNGAISEQIIRNAVSQTENGFINLVRGVKTVKELIQAAGSCCLAGLIWKGTLYIANLGDSRAVVGILDGHNKIVAEQLTRDDNARLQEVRDELQAKHPDDRTIVVLRNGVWRVKGIIQVSRSIGDLYLKSPEFAFDRSYPQYYLPEPIARPVLSSEPSISTRVLQPDDKFLIFASDGLWEHLTNQQAVDIVHKNPRAGIARRLVVTAQNMAANKSRINYEQLKRVDKEDRRKIHDDITVVVIFLDKNFDNRTTSVQEVSIRGYMNSDTPSKFHILQENNVSSIV